MKLPHTSTVSVAKFDQDFIDNFTQHFVLQPHNYFDENALQRQEQQTLFWQQKIQDPTLFRPKVFKSDIQAQIQPLLALQDQMSQQAPSLVVQLYQARVQELLDGLALVQASKDKDWDRWQVLNETLYGSINPHLFAGLYGYFQSQARSVVLQPQTTLPQKQSAQKFLSFFSQTVSTPLYQPKKELMQALQQQVQPAIANLSALVPLQDFFDADEACAVFEKVFKTFGLDATWTVQKNPKKTKGMLRVNRKQRLMMIPKDFMVSRKKILAILVHEIGVSPEFSGHILRSFHGSHSPLALLGQGLNHYNKGEEGICILWEQLLSGKYVHERKMLLYFFLGVITGMSGKKLAFRETYDLVHAYHGFQFSGMSELDRQKKSYDVCMRLFRGTPGNIPGVAFMKDKIYYEGNVSIWQYLEKNPTELARFSQGSYDPTLQNHKNALYSLGILEPS